MAAIRAAILFLHCMSFPLTMYPIVHTFTKFEQNRRGGSKVMSDLIFSKSKMAAIGAAILVLLCTSFLDILYPTVQKCSKFEQNRTSGSKAIRKIRF